MPQRKSQYQIWYEQVKQELLTTEPQNILARAECCQNIINECMNHLNITLNVSSSSSSSEYICQVKPRDHLKFLLNWPGLRIDNSPKAPKSKKEYEKKSKNWLNGRRAPNYGKTLFPFFITDAEKYILLIAKKLIPNNNIKQKLYYDIVIYKVLAQLCGCSVSLHEQAKKAPFFCKNSIERKGRLKEILQSYASDHEYIQGFPSCFEEAIGFFDRKSNEYFHRYRRKYLGYIDQDDEDDDDINTKKSIITKREQGFRSVRHHETEYWKNQALKLEQQIEIEKKLRIQAEAERDTLRSLIQSNHSTNLNHHNINRCNCESPECNQQLGLTNDSSFNSSSSNGSTASTTSFCNLSLPTSNPYGMTAAYNNGNNHNNNNGRNGNNQHGHYGNNQHGHSGNLSSIIGYVPNNTSLQINHSRHHFKTNNYVPFVNNCNNNNNCNVFMHPDRSDRSMNNNVSDGYSCTNSSVISNNHQNVLSQNFSNRTICNQQSILPTTTNSNHHQSKINNNNNNHGEQLGAFSSMIESMPMMNRVSQISDDSFGFDASFNSPMYSYQNAAAVSTANDHHCI